MKSIEKILTELQQHSPSPQILPVSKGQAVSHIEAVLKQYALPPVLGENYLEELKEKSTQMPGVRWHFLGRLQSRKILEICDLVSVIHTVSRAKELELIAKNPRPSFFIQMNISQEAQKNGCEVEDLPGLLSQLKGLGLEKNFLGLMGMAAPLEVVGEGVVRDSFRPLRKLRDDLAPGRGLSMGMSSDYKIAIEEGSTLLRLGSLLFGERLR